MDLSLNNNRPSFGMAVLFEKSATPVMKEQATKLSKKGYQKFWDGIESAINRQEANPNNIIVRKAKHRNALVAEVVDADTANAMKNYVTAQGLISRNGSLKFLNRAEKRANALDDLNRKVDNLPKAVEDVEEMIIEA
ncbi:MAG: hypothetical protein K6E29_02165 [Cyanobacteria bacterium RUI128]|nr:hypothetical protein [Cyanobacteria bacterium RUI128]